MISSKPERASQPVAVLIIHPEMSFEELALGVVLSRALCRSGYSTLVAFAQSSAGRPRPGFMLYRGVGLYFPTFADQESASEVLEGIRPAADWVCDNWSGSTDQLPEDVRDLATDWEELSETLSTNSERPAVDNDCAADWGGELVGAIERRIGDRFLPMAA